MQTLSESTIASLLAPYVGDANVPDTLYTQLSIHLELLSKWNARMNLTAIRNPNEIVRRHYGESIFLARHLPPALTMLDIGSGAGFPGIPIQLYLPQMRVTLAECQGKKASFLRECVRVLELSTAIWSSRAEAMPAEERFDVVTMRAVDKMETMLPAARDRVVPGGWLALLANGSGGILVPESKNRIVQLTPC